MSIFPPHDGPRSILSAQHRSRTIHHTDVGREDTPRSISTTRTDMGDDECQRCQRHQSNRCTFQSERSHRQQLHEQACSPLAPGANSEQANSRLSHVARPQHPQPCWPIVLPHVRRTKRLEPSNTIAFPRFVPTSGHKARKGNRHLHGLRPQRPAADEALPKQYWLTVLRHVQGQAA